MGQKRNPERNCVTHYVDWSTTFIDSLGRSPQPLARLPTREIPPQDEEFPPNLNDRNAIFFNNPAEMPDGEACQLGGRWNVQKHLVSSRGRGCGLCQHRLNPPFRSVL